MHKRKMPMRMCIGCKEMKPKRELVRVVHNKEGEVSLDLTGKKAGRGAYICADTSCLNKARKGHLIEKAFKRSIPQTVYDEMEKELGGDE